MTNQYFKATAEIWDARIKAHNQEENKFKIYELANKKLPFPHSANKYIEFLDEPMQTIIDKAYAYYAASDKKDLENPFSDNIGKGAQKEDIDDLVELVKYFTIEGETFLVGDLMKIYLHNDTSQLIDWAISFSNMVYKGLKISPFQLTSGASASYYCMMNRAIKDGIQFDDYTSLPNDKKYFTEEVTVTKGRGKNMKEIKKVKRTITKEYKDDQMRSYKLWEDAMQGGISLARRQRVTARPGKSYINSFDGSALYPGAMRMFMPFKGFLFATEEELERFNKDINGTIEEEFKIFKTSFMEDGHETRYSSLFRIDGYFPPETHDNLNDYGLLPIKKHITEKDVSQVTIKNFRKVYPKGRYDGGTKLIHSLEERKGYVCDILQLWYAVQKGFVVTKIHELQEFKTREFLKEYLDELQTLRNNSLTNIEGETWKLLSNSSYGRMMLNQDRPVELKIRRCGTRAEKFVYGTNTKQVLTVGDSFVITGEKHYDIQITTPRFVSIYTLLLTKTEMAEKWFMIKESCPSARLVGTDTDSLHVHIDIEKEFPEKKTFTGVAELVSRINTYANSLPLKHTGVFINEREQGKGNVGVICTSEFMDPTIIAQGPKAKRIPHTMKPEDENFVTDEIYLAAKCYYTHMIKTEYYTDVEVDKITDSMKYELKMKRMKYELVDDKHLRLINERPNDYKNITGFRKAKVNIRWEEPMFSEFDNNSKAKIKMKGVETKRTKKTTFNDFAYVLYGEKTMKEYRIGVDSQTYQITKRNDELFQAKDGVIMAKSIWGFKRDVKAGTIATVRQDKIAMTAVNDKSFQIEYEPDDRDQVHLQFGHYKIEKLREIEKLNKKKEKDEDEDDFEDIEQCEKERYEEDSDYD